MMIDSLQTLVYIVSIFCNQSDYLDMLYSHLAGYTNGSLLLIKNSIERFRKAVTSTDVVISKAALDAAAKYLKPVQK